MCVFCVPLWCVFWRNLLLACSHTKSKPHHTILVNWVGMYQNLTVRVCLPKLLPKLLPSDLPSDVCCRILTWPYRNDPTDPSQRLFTSVCSAKHLKVCVCQHSA